MSIDRGELSVETAIPTAMCSKRRISDSKRAAQGYVYDEANGWREHKLQAEVMGYVELGYRQEMHQFSRAKQLSSRARSQS